MKKRLFFLLAVLLALPLAACGPKSSARDFYSMNKVPPGDITGTIWLGMTKDEVQAATYDIASHMEARVHYDKSTGQMTSVTSIVKYIHPVGVTWDMNREQVKAFYAKDPAVTVTEAPNLLTAAKTIDGTVYYARYVFYDDDTIKEINMTTDPSYDTLKFPGQS